MKAWETNKAIKVKNKQQTKPEAAKKEPQQKLEP